MRHPGHRTLDRAGIAQIALGQFAGEIGQIGARAGSADQAAHAPALAGQRARDGRSDKT